ncbi:MAG: DUF799 family lipoprotein [Deltaproteobacteria bacterium]|nr:DUF799 family lipoprotein [Deltaproteobacteria bacterium]
MRFPRLFSIAALVLLSGCSGTYKNSVNFSPREPIRVAVMPFAQVDSKGQIIKPDDSLLIDNVELISSHLKETPAEFVEGLVEAELEHSGLDVIAPASVDGKLLHSGFGNTDLSFNLAKIFAANPQEICDELLGCDAVLYGKITAWSRSYYAIQSSSVVGIELKLVSARDGRVLFSSEARDSDSRGLTKGPTGFSDLVIEPLKGLDNQIITDLARSVVPKMLAPLMVENRPEFLNSGPPTVYASATDKADGRMTNQESLQVLLFGTEKLTASFSIGDYVQHVPMAEKDPGHYIGEYFPLSSDSFQDQPVYVFLTDEFGRTTRQKVGAQSLTLAKIKS